MLAFILLIGAALLLPVVSAALAAAILDKLTPHACIWRVALISGWIFPAALLGNVLHNAQGDECGPFDECGGLGTLASLVWSGMILVASFSGHSWLARP